jgi:N-glycosylase/DNA lyase
MMGKAFAELILGAKADREKEAKAKLAEFAKNAELDADGKFVELCFCILVANTNLEKTKSAWEKIGEGFLYLDRGELSKRLKGHGYRFYNVRSKFIVEARDKKDEIERNFRKMNENELRQWLHDNIKGLGWKESSHFLRNMGYLNFGILDTHVIGFMRRQGLIEHVPKSLSSKKTYFGLEEKLGKISKALKISMAELDMYMFYLDSGKMPQK